MCLDDLQLDRRRALALGIGGFVLGRHSLRIAKPAVRLPLGGAVEIRPRDDWGADLPVRGDVVAEPDVRFLLVHHTAGSNTYRVDQVAEQIRQVYAFHTGPQKRWPDVRYNFFVDRHGGIWEGRAGSASGPVMADATGGSQGFAQLVCLLGNFDIARPTPAMLSSLELLLAWLGERNGLDPMPGATTTFTSRGSQRWPLGSTVTARIISAHREMSYTACPGRHVAPLLDIDLPYRVARRRRVDLPSTPSPPATMAAPVASAGDRRVTLTWEPPAERGALPITGYRITASPGGRVTAASSSPIDITGLINGTAYTFRIAARNAVGAGVPSMPSAPVMPSTVPGRPPRPWARSGTASAVVSWGQPSSGGSPITQYLVTASPGGLTCTSLVRTCTMTGLEPGVAYSFTVYAVNARGAGTSSLPSVPVTVG
jgi:hypothetical protein